VKRFNCKRLKDARATLGWSQEKTVLELYSEGLELSRQTWIRYEGGETEPDIGEMLIIARVLKQPLDFFLSPSLIERSFQTRKGPRNGSNA